MAINGKSDNNTCGISGKIKWEPRFSTPQGYTFLKFTIVSEVLNQGEVKGWEYTPVQLSGDDAVAWHQRGTLRPDVYVYAERLRKRSAKPYQDNQGEWRSGDYMEFSSFNGSTLVIDADHEENAGLVTRPINAQTGKPVEAPEEEAPEGGMTMPTRTVPTPSATRLPTRSLPPTRSVPSTRLAAPARPASRAVTVPVASPVRRTPTAAEQKANAAAAATREAPIALDDDDGDLPF